MYIKKLFIRNFRGFGNEGISLDFQDGINIIIGENNIGKSSIIDVLRLALTSGQYKKGFYIGIDDFHIDDYGNRANEIDIVVYFEGLTHNQGVAFYELTNGSDTTKAELHIKYIVTIDNKGKERVKDYIRGGSRENTLSREVFDNINLTYMAALRDVESNLRPSRNSQIANLLFSYASTEEDKNRIISIFNDANNSVMEDSSIIGVENIINKNLNLIEKEELNQQISISLVKPTFESIAGTLDIYYKNKFICITKKKIEEIKKKTKVKDIENGIIVDLDSDYVKVNMDKLKPVESLNCFYRELMKERQQENFGLSQNGLGYNNLLSMATTLGDLQEKPLDEELSVLLVEEPEAHLHPQLLDLLFNFFKQSNRKSNIQIFMTSHSPTLISKADIDSLNILYSYENKTSITSIRDLDMEEEEKEDLKRYLDVTKSQLFFAKRVLFVEGISEAILFSEFAKLLKKPFDKYSIEVVNINGVAFKPFAKLFMKNSKENNLKYRCAIVSDNDKCTNKDDDYFIDKEELKFSTDNVSKIKDKLSKGSISNRAKTLKEFESENIKVFLAEKTFEYELALIKENIGVLVKVLKTIHPIKAKNIEIEIKRKTPANKVLSQDEIAVLIWLAIRDCKGIFAQRLANEISKISIKKQKDSDFIVPDYIKNAINYLVGEV